MPFFYAFDTLKVTYVVWCCMHIDLSITMLLLQQPPVWIMWNHSVKLQSAILHTVFLSTKRIPYECLSENLQKSPPPKKKKKTGEIQVLYYHIEPREVRANGDREIRGLQQRKLAPTSFFSHHLQTNLPHNHTAKSSNNESRSAEQKQTP